MRGRAGACPSYGVPSSAEGNCGVEASVESVVDVRTGVRWMCGLMSWWASWTEARVSRSVDERLVMAGVGRWNFKGIGNSEIVSLCGLEMVHRSTYLRRVPTKPGQFMGLWWAETDNGAPRIVRRSRLCQCGS